jgi:hypothetical protein
MGIKADASTLKSDLDGEMIWVMVHPLRMRGHADAR